MMTSAAEAPMAAKVVDRRFMRFPSKEVVELQRWSNCPANPSPRGGAALRALLDRSDGDLAVHPVSGELDLVAGFDALEQRRILSTEHHGHRVHVEVRD